MQRECNKFSLHFGEAQITFHKLLDEPKQPIPLPKP
jgi:hypothetical protein